jgi:hypothetical protein
VDPRHFLFPVVTLNNQDEPEWLCGNSFPITEDGGLITCRHVVSKPDAKLAVIDRLGDLRVLLIEDVIYPKDDALDLAFLPRALDRASKRFPLLPAQEFRVGESIHTYGFYSQSGRVDALYDGYFAGNVVRFYTDNYSRAVLSFPVIEGLSGSPVMVYHNGTKAAGICYGSEQQRVLAAEIVDSHDGDVHYRETVNRVVEFGLALRSEVIASFAAEIPDCEPVITSDRVPDPELE